MRAPRSTIVCVLLSAAACAKVAPSLPIDQGVGGAGGGGSSRTGEGGARSMPRDAGTGVVIDTGMGDGCGSFTFKPTPKTAVLMLVLDRSGSMKNSLPNSAGTKWTVVTAAVNPAISATQNGIQWGMKTFPGDSGCAVAAGIDVPVAPMNAAMMTAKIGMTMPEGDGTPTGDGVLAAATYLQGLATTDPKYILLATDGDPTCPGDGITYALQQVAAARTAGIPTFVIGVGTGHDSSTNLDNLAVAGGQARPVTNPLETKYFPADSPDELAMTLKAITGQIASCVFSLGQRPPDMQFVNVTLGATEIPYDVAGVDGWQFAAGDTSTITVVGNWCDQIQSSPEAVGIVFGCKPPIIP
jgi:hypothetical protein